MIISDPATRILGLLALLAAGGCGSEPGQSPVPPPAASSASIPKERPPAVPPTGPGNEVIEVAPHPIPHPRRRFRAPLRAPAVATSDPELDPLVSYLKASFASAITDGGRLIIDDMTDVKELQLGESYQVLVDQLLGEASDQIPAEMIRDPCEKNREARMIWPELIRHLPADLLTSRERDAIFSLSDGWTRFYEKHPRSPGIITISRVGLNREKTLALFYVGTQRHWLHGAGELHILKKEGDVRVELPVRIGPSWIS